MADFSFDISVDNTGAVLEELEDAIARALEICGGKAETYAKKICVVGTPESTGIKGYRGGTLRNSITHAIGGKSPSPSTYTSFNDKGHPYNGIAGQDKDHTVYIGSNVEYASNVELGIRRKTAKPFLRPAIEDHIDEYKQIITKELSK